MKFYKVSWEELEEDCFAFYKKIKKYKFDRILCISRGGLVWSRMFSDLLSLPISHLTAISYSGIHEQKDVKIKDLPDKDIFKNQTLLVVDEIADHGKTFAKVKEYLQSIKVKKYYTLAPIIRTYTKPRPDFYLDIIDEWIIYPYELRETYEAFLKIYKTSKKAKEMLLKNGFKKYSLRSLF
ncbi:MAG: phosphoribosyltransferase family protein [Candidatus Roizmanbacteria bacterium]